MRNEDRVNPVRPRRQRRNIDWKDIAANLTIGALFVAIVAAIITPFVFLGIAVDNSQSSYDVEFCNLDQSDIDYLINGSTNNPAINCSITEQWFAVTTITCKTKGLQSDVTEFINMGNVSCWRYKDN